jgi:succinate dehydrogenase cytochrome b subunit
MMKKTVKKRPKNLDLRTIRLPINAIVSILHRASGAVLFLALPLLLLALQASLSSEQSYNIVANILSAWIIKLLLIGLFWAFIHHFYAGLRHLGQDVHWMTSLQKARLSSRLVLGLTACSVLLFAIWIW